MAWLSQLTRPGGRGAAALLIAMAVMLSGCGINTIPTKEETAKAAWSEVLNQYQRRSYLFPNLVNTVNGSATQDRRC